MQTRQKAGSRCSAPARTRRGSAARLRRLGFAVACLPVIEVVAACLRRRNGRATTRWSPPAPRRLPPTAPVDRAAPLYVVGARTARAAEARGWRLAAPPAPDAGGSLETLKGAIPPGAAVLYLAGRDRKPAIESALSGASRARGGRSLCGRSAAKAGGRQRSARSAPARFALHYSRRSAALAAELAESGGRGRAVSAR